MSGSSLDGVDLALCMFSEEDQYVIEKAGTIPLPLEITNSLSDPLAETSKSFLQLSARFSLFLAAAAKDFLKGVKQQPQLIVSHGHTVYHDPASLISCQIGNGGVIAAITGIDTLSDLRIQDVALGGQGAPLASLVDRYLFNDYNFMLNLGGIANVSCKEGNKTFSWDVSPCNQVLNKLSGRLGLPYDPNGEHASKGKKDDKLYSSWQSIEYFTQQPPKSLDNYWVSDVFSSFIEPDMPIENGLNTMCHFIADQLIRDLHKYLPQGSSKMVITGGGGHNDYLVQCIRKAASPHKIEVVIPSKEMIDFKEALLMAYMGHRYIQRKVNVLASATGGDKDIIAGALYLGNG